MSVAIVAAPSVTAMIPAFGGAAPPPSAVAPPSGAPASELKAGSKQQPPIMVPGQAGDATVGANSATTPYMNVAPLPMTVAVTSPVKGAPAEVPPSPT